MGLRDIAEADLAFILEDQETGWGWGISLVSPAQVTYPNLAGSATDISQAINPETGAFVSGRTASVALRISSLALAGITTLPQGVTKSSEKPWVVKFLDLAGNLHTFKVSESRPDRTLGVLILILENYTA